MLPIPFIAIVPGLVLAALTPAKVTDEKTNSSAMRSVHQPKVIYVKSFSIRAAASQSDDSAGAGRPHLLGSLRGGEGNTVIGRHREQQQEDTLAKVPGVLQNVLIEDLSKSIAPAANVMARAPHQDLGLLPVNSLKSIRVIAPCKRALVLARERVTSSCGHGCLLART